MNVSELSTALHAEADELDLVGAVPQLPRVHSRVRTVRRWRRTAVGAIGAVAIGAATTLALILPDRAGREPAPVKPVQGRHYEAPVFPARIGAYHLVGQRIGAPGDSHLSLVVDRPAGRFTVTAVCSGPSGALDTELVVNGTSPGGVSCTPHPRIRHMGWPTQDLTADGVDLRARSVTIGLTLVRGRFSPRPASDPGTVLSLAVYQRDHSR